MNDIMDLSPRERDELLNAKPLFEFTAVLTDDRIETEYGSYRYGELLGEILTIDPYDYAQAYFAMSDAYYEGRLEDYKEAERRAEKLLFQMPLYRDLTDRCEELSDHRRSNPYANKGIHESMHVTLMLLLEYHDALTRIICNAGNNTDREKMYGELLSSFADIVSGNCSPKHYIASPDIEYVIRQSDDGTTQHCRKIIFSKLQ